MLKSIPFPDLKAKIASLWLQEIVHPFSMFTRFDFFGRVWTKEGTLKVTKSSTDAALYIHVSC